MSQKKYDDVDVRLCRLRPWRTYNSLGFQLRTSPKSRHVIDFIESNSPAAAGGLKFWDILLKINGKDIRKIADAEIKNILKSARYHYGQYVELLVVQGRYYHENLTDKLLDRLSSSVEIITTPAFMPDDYKQNSSYTPRVCEIRLKTNENKFGFDATRGKYCIGLFIQTVRSNSPAYRAGLCKCDRVIEINDKYVDKSQSNDIIEMIKNCLMKKYIKLLVIDTQTYEKSVSKKTSVPTTPREVDLDDDIYIYSESDPLSANYEHDLNSQNSYLPCTPEPSAPIQDSYTVVSDIREIYTYERFVDAQNEQLTTFIPYVLAFCFETF